MNLRDSDMKDDLVKASTKLLDHEGAFLGVFSGSWMTCFPQPEPLSLSPKQALDPLAYMESQNMHQQSIERLKAEVFLFDNYPSEHLRSIARFLVRVEDNARFEIQEFPPLSRTISSR